MSNPEPVAEPQPNPSVNNDGSQMMNELYNKRNENLATNQFYN